MNAVGAFRRSSRRFIPSSRIALTKLPNQSVFCSKLPRFVPHSSAVLVATPQNARPAPVLGPLPESARRTLLKVKSRGHVYPLSYLPYF
jgi:hypothetical protein